jgi:SAM-dependent methyltransferase
MTVNIDLSGYDFVDFGCSHGGSTVFAQDRFGGKRGLGLDIDPRKVENANAAGHDAMVADVTTLDAKEMGSVRFVIMSHFLEHLPTRKLAELCIRSACDIANEFVFIRQPFFDADGYLFSLGMKLYWSNWSGHKNHMTSLEFHNILAPLLDSKKLSRFQIFYRTKIDDSSHDAIHPISSPLDCHRWVKDMHSAKKFYEFDYPVYHETGAIILKKGTDIPRSLRAYLRHCDVMYDSIKNGGAV